MSEIPKLTDAAMGAVLRRMGPRGFVWLSERWVELSNGLAAELNTARSRIIDLVSEADPRTCDELLDEWESVYGLPSRCGGTLPSTDDERRAALAAKVAARGGQRAADIIAVCAAAGYTVTITTYSAFLYGVNTYYEPMYDEAWAYHFDVVGSGGAIPDWLQCIVRDIKPAHVTVGFS